MAEYYEKETLLDFVKNYTPHFGDTTSLRCVERAIKNAPTADVVEVVHGYWKETITHNGCTWDSDCVCSVCGKSGHPCNNYCEECGAKMDGKGG